VALMKNGEIIQRGTPKEMFQSPVSAWAAHFLLFENIFEAKAIAADQYSFENIIIYTDSGVPEKMAGHKSSDSDNPLNKSQWLACKAEALSVRETTDSEDASQTDFFTAIAGDTFHYGLTEVIELFMNEEKTAKLYAKAPVCSIKPGAIVIAEYERTQIKLVEG
jgi:ABC-type Fe3+/spermidine/putrescine transport system ATPase subunit